MTTREQEERTAALECPDCGLSNRVVVPALRRGDQFCDNCDYPLFWASGIDALTPDAPAPLAQANDPVAVADVEVETHPTEACAVCEKVNLAGARYCVRCGSEMHPHPEPFGRWLIVALVFWVLVAAVGAAIGIAWLLT